MYYFDFELLTTWASYGPWFRDNMHVPVISAVAYLIFVFFGQLLMKTRKGARRHCCASFKCSALLRIMRIDKPAYTLGLPFRIQSQGLHDRLERLPDRR